MLNGVILHKLEALDEVLNELSSLGSITETQLNHNWMVHRAIERDLQIAVEVMLDVCHRIISLAGQAPVTVGREAIERCVQLGALSGEEPYRRMIQFRNFVVHHYQQVDAAILVNIVNTQLSDFEKFRDEILAYAQR